MQQHSILLVDDDPIITAGTGSDLEEKGYAVTTAESGERAIELLEKSPFDLVITDLVMGPINGIGVLIKAKEINRETIVLLLTGFGDVNSAIEALRLGADDYILKPCEPEEMYFRVSRCLEKLELKRRIRNYERILSVCPMCKKIKEVAEKKDVAARWVPMEKFMHDEAKIDINPSYCPECASEFSELGIDIGLDLSDL